MAQWRVKPVNLCPKIDVYESDCSNRHKREADDEDAARQTPGHGQGIPVGSIRSASHNSHSAMVIVARSADPVRHAIQSGKYQPVKVAEYGPLR